jgi:uncharacterized protein YukE
MPNLPSEPRTSRLRTRLEASLIRLQTALRPGVEREDNSETLYDEWQNRWASRREELSRRLSAIDSQLDSWAQKGSDAPRLAVLGEDDELVVASPVEFD